MADLEFTKRNQDFYYCLQNSGATLCSTNTAYTIRWSSSTNSWIRTRAFTTGDYRVTRVTITLNDMAKCQYGTPVFGISTTAQNYPSATSIPSLLWSGSDSSNSTASGYNEYSTTFDVALEPRTEYYLYICLKANSTSSSLAWDCLVYPHSSYPNRTTVLSVNFDSKTYSPATYKATPQKGTGINSVSGGGNYTKGASVTFAATVSSGYNFLNWTNEKGSILSTNSSYTFSMPASEIKYTANASLKTYQINYKKDSYSTGTEITDIKTHNIDIQLRNSIFERDGYIQTGWTTTKGGTQTHAVLEFYGNNNNLTLYPVWTAGVSVIEYNPGSYGIGDIIYDTKTNNINITLKGALYTRIGYKQTAWTDGIKNYNLNSIYSSNTALMLTPVWTPITYQISYNSNGATSGSMSNSYHTYNKAQMLNTNNFIKTNYNFINWVDNESHQLYNDKEEVINLTTEDNKIINLTAQWSLSTYTIKFDLNQGHSINNFNNMVCERNISYYIPRDEVKRSNYVFLGWSTSAKANKADYQPGQEIKNLGDIGDIIILYAVWRAKIINIKYHINDGLTIRSMTVSYDTTLQTNRLASFPSDWEREGYQALGWNVSDVAISSRYHFNESFLNDFNLNDGETLDLYIVWSMEQPWTLATIVWKINGKEYKF